MLVIISSCTLYGIQCLFATVLPWTFAISIVLLCLIVVVGFPIATAMIIYIHKTKKGKNLHNYNLKLL